MGSKLVVAHFMVGNTFPYTINDWKEDIELASIHGIDAFVLNVGVELWQKDSVKRCYAAASESDYPFKLCLSFDMSSMRASSREDAYLLKDYIAIVAKHPRQLLYDGKALVSTFAGQDSLFGHSTLHEAWQFVKDTLEETTPIHLIPSFFIDPRRYPDIPAMDGYFNWTGSWPIHLTVGMSREIVQNAELETDRHHIHHLEGRTFMAAVSPWFFTHYGADSWNKNWIHRGEDLYVRRWQQLIEARHDIDIVQVISWNDYGESHYVGPVKGAQPNSQAWVDGFPHTAWLDLTRYFARAFKEGAYPPIERDKIYLWSRPHLKAAEAVDDPVGRPDRWQLVDDSFWVIVFTTGPAYICVGTQDHTSDVMWAVGGGMHKRAYPMSPGGGMKAQIIRNGAVVAECAPSLDEFRVRERPQVYNFNAFVAMSA
ncbi:glycoside hydrolase family 71 protein [Lenzites betulinus]|nr:glycoside hydrolase family 71 protein [Lenzites betulinus]